MQAYIYLLFYYLMFLTNRSWTHHSTCDVTVTSFYIGLTTKRPKAQIIIITTNLNKASTFYAGMCVASVVLLLLRIVKILREGKWGQKYAPQRLTGGAEDQRPPG